MAGSELSTPKVIVHFIRAGHCLSISYQKAWCAREAVLNDIRKSSVESYKMLPRFAYILELNNPSSVVEYKVDVDSRFHYFFMILSVFTSGWQHCRPVISIDGTSMENKYGGTLLSASTSNVNDQIFHLAFCVVDYENDSSWTWFCNQLKRIIDGRNEVVMVFDRHKSICKAIELVFPNVLHCMCLVHLLRNLKLKYKRIVDIVFHACGKIFNIVDFEHEMRLLESSAPGIR
ncbi:protein FAR-RED ELONGATED HYPOCOTYL 3-like [Cucumis melo]|uniref:Protein FAR-RED ELONGATED HYPOCOTYL 3-like n=1 Tax=Cucumis melo TaxID=3656 RepID=A0ABM3KLG1_CUCME|nr:protein FAR-RED ELONGATED HYPOCOTYL 3-like [Cucumis melo]